MGPDMGQHSAALRSQVPPLAGVRNCKGMFRVGENPFGNGARGTAIRTLDGGHTWTLTPMLPKGIGALSDISCPTTSYCMAVGLSTANSSAVAVATRNAGRIWRRVPLPKGEEDLSLVTCTSSAKCVAEGTMEATVGEPSAGERLSIITTADGGSIWRHSSLSTAGSAPVGIPYFSGLTCPTRTSCLLVGDATPGDGSPSGLIYSSIDDGDSWALRMVPPGTTFLNAVSCASATQCAVVGGGIEARGGSDRDILTTRDGGQSWTSQVVPTSAVGLEGVSCPALTSCVAVGFGFTASDPDAEPAVVVVSRNGGTTWTTAP
jgi:photosystem II stability/assembly factor-like uncharacterized protein